MEEPRFIKSAHGSGRIELGNAEPGDLLAPVDSFTVTFGLEGLQASVQVYSPSFHQGPESLARFFDDLAANWRGWAGEKGWGSLEGEFAIRCTCDRLGHTEMRITLRKELEWETSGSLIIEAGQLRLIAQTVRRFLRC
jgi:Family of unknown function (DUF6228)